jgi:hypothetical protein
VALRAVFFARVPAFLARVFVAAATRFVPRVALRAFRVAVPVALFARDFVRAAADGLLRLVLASVERLARRTTLRNSSAASRKRSAAISVTPSAGRAIFFG